MNRKVYRKDKTSTENKIYDQFKDKKITKESNREMASFGNV